jgi:hypothetical protein
MSLLDSHEESPKGWALGTAVIVFVVVAVAGFFGYSHFTRPAKDDKTTLCPAAGPLGHVVVLVDKSDPMTFTQRKSFNVIYRDLVTQVQRGHLLSVYALDEDFKSTAEPLLEMCNPGDGRGVSTFDDNPGQRKKVYETRYLKPFLDREEELVTESSGKASPIIEMMQLVGITGFRKHAVAGEKRLIIVSDMIHNTSGLSMYKGVPDYSSFGQTSYGVKSRADLKDVAVELRMLMNTPAIQNEKLLEFWKTYIRQSGGRLVLHDPING